MGKYQLGEFEEIVMLTVGVLYGDAYGVTIKKDIETRLVRKVSVGALQSALKRLEQKGYLSDKAKGVNKEKLIEVTAQLFQIYCEHAEKNGYCLRNVKHRTKKCLKQNSNTS